MTIAEMYAIRPDENRWRQLPNGNCVRLGDGVALGNHVALGDWVTLGDWVRLGDDVVLGHGVVLGDWVRLGDDVVLGHGVVLGDRVRVGDGVRVGNYVTLGDGVKLGNGVRLGNGVTVGNGVWLSEKTEWTTSPLQIQGSRHFMYHAGPGLVGVGCQVHPFRLWEAEAACMAKAYRYTKEQVEEYLRYFELMKVEDARRFPREGI